MKLFKHISTDVIAELISSDKTDIKLKLVDTGEIKEMKFITFQRWWKGVSEEEKPIPNNTETTEPQHFALSNVIEKLENLFDILNRIYFEDKLPKPVITIQSSPQAYGHCSTKKVWSSNDEKEAYYEINIGAEFLNNPSDKIASTMCHEMIHLYCLENDLSDTCQNGRYHNKLFKEEGEKRDLSIGYNRTVGYSETTPTEVFSNKLLSEGYELKIELARRTVELQKERIIRKKAHKYICSGCGQKVSSTAELHLICGICEIPMERAE